MTDGIHISREVADKEGVPHDLDANAAGPYRFPNPRRRIIPGYLYLAGALWAGIGQLLFLAGLCLVLGAWHLLAAHPVRSTQEEALDMAAGRVVFPIGHASAALAFSGLRSRPRWQIVAYSGDEPPTQRALIEIDAVSGSVVGEPYVELIPEPPAKDG